MPIVGVAADEHLVALLPQLQSLPSLDPHTTFIRNDVGFLNDAKPLVIHDGLLLLRILPKPRDKNIFLRLCVCNMNTGKHDLLPRINSSVFGDDGPMGYAILTANDHSAGLFHLLSGASDRCPSHQSKSILG